MLTINVRGADSLAQLLKRASGAQMRAAAAGALNDFGFAAMREMRAQIAGAFNQPTAFIARSPKVKKADEKTLRVRVWPTINTEGRGGAVTPQMVLAAQERGGRRADKRSERALRALGLLPEGMQTALPRRPYPGSVKGNDLSGSFIRRVLRGLRRRSATAGRKRRGGARRAAESFWVLRQQRGRLPPGVYGTHGGQLAAVLFFVRPASYSSSVSTQDVMRAVGGREFIEEKLQRRLRRVFEGGGGAK